MGGGDAIGKSAPERDGLVDRSIVRWLLLLLGGAFVGSVLSAPLTALALWLGVWSPIATYYSWSIGLIAGLWLTRMVQRETAKDRSLEGVVAPPGVRLGLLWPLTYLFAWALVLFVIFQYRSTAPVTIGFILASLAIGLPAAFVFVQMGREHLRSVRRFDGRCQRCGYQIVDNPHACSECGDPNIWREYERRRAVRSTPPTDDHA